MTQLRINEVFQTLQGEGHWVGTPSTFIRLQGCEVCCPWCDTKHTWPAANERKRIEPAAMLAKEDSAPTWAYMQTEDLVADVLVLKPRHFVITGGEPCEQDIYDLTVLLSRQGRVQIETSGTRPVIVAFDTWVTVSPKFDMPGGLPVLDQALDRANEIKMPVSCPADIAKLYDRLNAMGDRCLEAVVELQPVSLDGEATKLCIEACIEYDWRLSLQTHKYSNVR